jgi:hypothetical protein
MKRLSAVALFTLASVFFAARPAHAKGAYPDDSLAVSTTPIGSPFLRHFAYDYNFDLHELIKFERKGFGRAEIITIALIAQKTGLPIKSYGKRRLNEKVSLRQLAEEAQMNYEELYDKAQTIKAAVEAKGDQNLPPPVFDKKPEPTPEPTPLPKPRKKEKAS